MTSNFNNACIFRKYSLPDSFLPIFLVWLTIADMAVRCQNISPNLKQRRPIMKISEGIEHFYNYQRLKVKKKYIAELWIHSQQIPTPFRQHRAILSHIRRYLDIYVRSFRWNQTKHKEATIHPSGCLFQFHQKFGRSWFPEFMRQSRPTETFQSRQTNSVRYSGKGRGRWDDFQNTKPKKSPDARTNGPQLHEGRRGPKTHS